MASKRGFTQAELMAAQWRQDNMNVIAERDEAKRQQKMDKRHETRRRDRSRSRRRRSRSRSRSRSTRRRHHHPRGRSASPVDIHVRASQVPSPRRDSPTYSPYRESIRRSPSPPSPRPPIRRPHSRSRSKSKSRDKNRNRSRSRDRSRSRSRSSSFSSAALHSPPPDPKATQHDDRRKDTHSRGDRAAPSRDLWTHDDFFRRSSPSPQRRVPKDYRPPSPEWISKAGGVYIPRKR